MNVVAIEYGERPVVMTKARRFAPEGAKMLAETLERFQFAQDGIIILDWDNSLGLQPSEVAKSVMVVRTGKYVPEKDNLYLTVEIRLDVEDIFGRDEITAENLLDIVKAMEDKMLADIARATKE